MSRSRARLNGYEPELDLTLMTEVVPEEVKWLWRGRIPSGKLTILAGDPSVGKSFLSLDIASRVSRGSAWPDEDLAPEGRKPKNVLIISGEDALEDTVRPRIDRQGGDPKRIAAIGLRVRDKDGDSFLSLTDHLSQIRDEVVRFKARLLIVDPLVAFMGTINTYKASEVRQLLTRLSEMADETKCSVLGIMHLNKRRGESGLYRLTDSLAFAAGPRSVMLVSRHPDDSSLRVLAPWKNNLTADPDAIGFHFDEEGRLAWDETLPLRADDMLIRLSTSPRGTIGDKARKFLQTYLADGSPHPATKIAEDAEAEGIGKASLDKVKRAMGVVSHKRSDGRFDWQLTASSSQGGGDLN
jgi:hypothetical protein